MKQDSKKVEHFCQQKLWSLMNIKRMDYVTYLALQFWEISRQQHWSYHYQTSDFNSDGHAMCPIQVTPEFLPGFLQWTEQLQKTLWMPLVPLQTLTYNMNKANINWDILYNMLIIKISGTKPSWLLKNCLNKNFVGDKWQHQNIIQVWILGNKDSQQLCSFEIKVKILFQYGINRNFKIRQLSIRQTIHSYLKNLKLLYNVVEIAGFSQIFL